jgi:hypothetical protein
MKGERSPRDYVQKPGHLRDDPSILGVTPVPARKGSDIAPNEPLGPMRG